MRRLLIFAFLLFVSFRSSAQDFNFFYTKFGLSSAKNFQEKLYVQTDRDSYTTGETIWFRIHRVDATYHNPNFYSGLVYVDIYDHCDKLVKRLMINKVDSVFSGSYKLHKMAHGSYYMVAYTNWAQNFDKEFYYRRKIFINNPENKAINLTHRISINKKGEFHFDFNILSTKEYQWVDERYLLNITVSGKNMQSKSYRRSITDEGHSDLNIPISDQAEIIEISFLDDLPEVYSQRFAIPYLKDSVDLQFLPEGGQLIAGVQQRIAFKAVGNDGLGVEVKGSVFNSSRRFESLLSSSHLGMGEFMLTPKLGQRYYAQIVMPNGKKVRYDLPEVQAAGIMLACSTSPDLVRIVAKASRGISWEGKYLLLHCRGQLLKAVSLEKSRVFDLPTESLPNGIIHCSIADVDGVIYTQRLVFMYHDDEPQVAIENLKVGYTRRSFVDLDLQFTDIEGKPVQGHFTASVVNDTRAIVDTTVANLRSYMLLSSDLTGNIEDPNYYFDTTKPLSDRLHSADLLMLTQGWRRFDIEYVLSDELREYDYSLQLGQSISGQLKHLWKDEGRTGSFILIAPTLNQVRVVPTDKDGFFEVGGLDFPIGTKFVVQGLNEKSRKAVEIEIEEDGFGRVVNPPIEQKYLFVESDGDAPISSSAYDRFYHDLNMAYYYDNGVLVYILEEVDIVAEEGNYYNSIDKMYRKFADYSIMGETMIEEGCVTVWDWLTRLPGVYVDDIDERLRVRGGTKVKLIVDEMSYPLSSLTYLSLEDIVSVSFSTDFTTIMTYSESGSIENMENAIILISLKEGVSMYSSRAKPTSSFFTIYPMGYTPADTFYVPKYETLEQKNGTDVDARVTIHWEPNIRLDEDGRAKLQFYTADAPANYLLRIEGVSDSGEPVSYTTRVRNQ